MIDCRKRNLPQEDRTQVRACHVSDGSMDIGVKIAIRCRVIMSGNRLCSVGFLTSLSDFVYFNSQKERSACWIIYLNTLRAGPFKLFKRPLPGFLTILTL